MRHILMAGMHGGTAGMMMVGIARHLATKLIILGLLLAVAVLWWRQRRRF